MKGKGEGRGRLEAVNHRHAHAHVQMKLSCRGVEVSPRPRFFFLFFFLPLSVLSAPLSGSTVEFIGQELFKGSNESVLFSPHGAKRCLANCFVVVSRTNQECVRARVCMRETEMTGKMEAERVTVINLREGR